MALRSSTLEASLESLDEQLAGIGTRGTVADAVERVRADGSALRFHLRTAGDRPPIVAILGGTGTGKSTLLNRLLGEDLSAASFRRTFTAGAIAVTAQRANIPAEWLGVAHEPAAAENLPARGQADRLIIVTFDSEITRRATLVDTPDLDGDQPLHHAQADRAFRWADAVLFLVTPEKYQMTELVPYYRLAARYGVPALHVMNKAEQIAVVSDYQARVSQGAEGSARVGGAPVGPVVFALPRDDANYEPPAELNLGALRQALLSIGPADEAARRAGIQQRAADLFDRIHDQVYTPLLSDRREIDRLVAMARAMETPPAGIDVNPITRQLARRLQQRSILYLMGPGKVIDRVRQVPALLARLPRTTWDLIMHGKAELGSSEDERSPREVPDFPAILAEQLAVLQSRIDDVVRAAAGGERWIAQDEAAYRAMRMPTERASAIADDELQQLKAWLENRWNATPRDTAILQKVLKHVPGGAKLTQWSEAAPYLLTFVVATHGALFGHVDLMIIGGYSLATWLTERLSNEVAARTRQANKAIADRFERLAHEQIEQACAWLEGRAPRAKELERLARTAEALQSAEK